MFTSMPAWATAPPGRAAVTGCAMFSNRASPVKVLHAAVECENSVAVSDGVDDGYSRGFKLAI